MKASTNLWLTLCLISILCTLFLIVLGGFAALDFFHRRAGQTNSLFDVWLESMKQFAGAGLAALGLGMFSLFCYRRYIKMLEKEK